MSSISWNDEQKKIIDHKEGNMIVSASAGSGKTTVMLERVMRLIESGTPIDKIVILAFNSSIASEIRGKTYNKIMQRLQEENCENKEFLQEQIDKLPFACIITNDSYCNKTTKEFFQILGIDPNVDILSEKESKIILKNIFENQIKKLQEQEQNWVFDLVLKFGGNDELFNQILKIHQFVTCASDGEKWLDDVARLMYTDELQDSKVMVIFDEIIQEKMQIVFANLNALISLVGDYPDVYNTYQGYLNFFIDFAKRSSYKEKYTLINVFSLKPKERKSKKFPIANDEEFVSCNAYMRDAVKEITNWYKDNYDFANVVYKSTKTDVEHLVILYKNILSAFKLQKSDVKKFNFYDFTDCVIKLLKKPEIQREISKRYDYICVDEYQDTNFAQEEIYENISNGNNLFMVGDSKQSIYRFRLSEPTILINKFNKYEQNEGLGINVKLKYNYRSSSGVVQFVNDIFNEIMTKESGGVDYEKTDQLSYGAKYDIPPSYPVAQIKLIKDTKEEKKDLTFDEVYSVKNDESATQSMSACYKEGLYIAKKIKEIVSSYKVYDVSLKAERSVRYSDIALLAKSGSSDVREIVKAIQDEQIPIDVAPLLKEKECYETEIIKDFLRLVNNDKQDYALTAVLTSFWVGLDYDDLLKIRKNHKDCEFFYQAVLQEKEENEKIAIFYKKLYDLRILSANLTVQEMAEKIVYDYGFDDYLLASSNGSYKLKVVKTFLQGLGELSKDMTLYEYVSNLDEEDIEMKTVASNDVVRAMTIHKSKGLEFPIVFICNIKDSLDKSKGLNAPRMQINKFIGIAINYFEKSTMSAYENLAFKVLKEKNKQETIAEAMRLFYVALTRAKNHLFLTGTISKEEMKIVPPNKATSFLDWIVYASENNPRVASAIEVIDTDFQNDNIMKRYSFMPYKGEKIEQIDKYLNFEYPYKKSVDLGINYSVTEINKNDHQTFELQTVSDDELQDNQEDRALRGTNYHKVMELIDFDVRSKAEVESQISQMVANNVLSEEEARQIDSQEIYDVLQMPIMQYAKKHKCFKEQEFVLKIKASSIMDCDCEDEIVVNGTIDLLIDGDELIIVDYKKTNENSEVLFNRYKKQLEIYSLAVEKAMGKKVTHAVLVVFGKKDVIIVF